MEELLFRLALPALLFGVLGGIPGAGPLAFGIAALLFGALHLYQGPLGILFAFILGLLFTALYIVTGSILAPIALHVAHRPAVAGAHPDRARGRVGSRHAGRAATRPAAPATPPADAA